MNGQAPVQCVAHRVFCAFETLYLPAATSPVHTCVFASTTSPVDVVSFPAACPAMTTAPQCSSFGVYVGLAEGHWQAHLMKTRPHPSKLCTTAHSKCCSLLHADTSGSCCLLTAPALLPARVGAGFPSGAGNPLNATNGAASYHAVFTIVPSMSRTGQQ